MPLSQPVVYFGQSSASRDQIKIGFTERRISERRRELSIITPDFDFLLVIPGSRELEARIKQRFHSLLYNQRRELFRYEGDLPTFVAELACACEETEQYPFLAKHRPDALIVRTLCHWQIHVDCTCDRGKRWVSDRASIATGMAEPLRRLLKEITQLALLVPSDPNLKYLLDFATDCARHQHNFNLRLVDAWTPPQDDRPCLPYRPPVRQLTLDGVLQ